MLVAIDTETACGVGCEVKCDHALDEHRNRITIIGAYYEESNGNRAGTTFRSVSSLRDWLDSIGPFKLVFHNGKFDLKTLAVKGLDLSAHWYGDTLLMASVLTEKVTEDYLQWYAKERARLNEKLPRGVSHRPGSHHSLKTLAPFFLGVEPFWENPADHDSAEYVLRDCEYTLRLYHYLEKRLHAEGSFDFYRSKLLPWTHLLFKAERRGIGLDLASLSGLEVQAHETSIQTCRKLGELWANAFRTYEENQRKELKANYEEKKTLAKKKLKDPSAEKLAKTEARYEKLCADACAKLEPLNLDSPTQLNWLLKDYLKLDITDFDGEETTGKAVLQRLAGQGREDIAEFLKYRKARKLSTAFFPSYRAMHVDGVIHCNFNPTGTRTGRLSSSSPNLQQIERNIKKLFVARPGYKLAVYDMAAIEPRLIAYYTHDLNLWDILAKGEDFHGYNTKIFFEMDCPVSEIKKKYPLEREVGKEVGLSLMYGSGPNRLMESAQKRGFVWSFNEARRKVQRFKEFYEGVYRFRDEVINPALTAGTTVTNIMGRPFRIEDPTNVHLQGMNTLIQGGASDLVLNSGARMDRTFRERGIDAHILAFEHDAIVVEIPEGQEAECTTIIEHSMTDYNLVTPLGPVLLGVEGNVATCWTK